MRKKNKVNPRLFKDPGILHDSFDAKVGPVRTKTKVRAALLGFFIGIGGFWAYNKIKNKFQSKELDTKTSADVIAYLLKRQADAELEERKRAAYRRTNANDTPDEQKEATYINEQDSVTWHEHFHSHCKYNFVDYPDVLLPYVANAPIGYEESVLSVLTAGLASCFSKVEARYLDGKWHRPNLHVCVEGEYGSGKGKLKDMYHSLFSRRIRRDNDKLDSGAVEDKIIQTISVSTTSSRLLDILANNRGVHCVAFEPEVKTACSEMKKNNGLGFDIIRKAYDNDEVSRINKDKNSPQGSFTVALNLILTGTPGDTKDFINKELEGGTTSRFCWCVIPPVGKDVPKFELPEGTALSKLQDQIDIWTEKYSYKTDEQGKETPAAPVQINLDYVAENLQGWIDEQYKKGDAEGNPARIDVRTRIATTAFHCAIVYAMLYGNPSAKERKKRQDVVDLTLYMVNYYMERFLHKFSKVQNEQRAQNRAAEMVLKASSSVEKPASSERNDEETEKWYRQHIEKGMSYNAIAEAAGVGVTKDMVSGRIKRFAKKHNLPLSSEDN